LERILAILTQQDNLRDVVMFPLMKPTVSSVETQHVASEEEIKEVKKSKKK
jgi:aspartyl-tRNA synthetase